jgi:alpha-galactosidase
MKCSFTTGSTTTVFLLYFYLFPAISPAQTTSGTIQSAMEIYTPVPKPQPRLNGPQVYGCRPGNPFLYRIPCQGNRPVLFSVKGLPPGLELNKETGFITGNAPVSGEYNLMITAANSSGKDKRKLKIVSGEKLALTPPMGWNDWYAHYDRITDKMMREAADIMVSSGMADVGYTYVNIDDCWMNAEKNNDPQRMGPLRDEKGNILPNRHFPDMKDMTDYIHSRGLKAGLYTSPGPQTCAGFAGSYMHEEQDARQFADWGFDFLKYDWCSYGRIANEKSSSAIIQNGRKVLQLEDYKLPYVLMGDILKKQQRDIVFNLCQYGMGDVWKWGGEIGGHCWRTAGDLGFELDRIFDVALKNCEYREYSKPGEWNDPDYIQIGWIGDANKMGHSVPTPMSANLQYSYMSLWCLMASPLIYSGDMTKLDPFTLNVLCNPEIIEVDQDPLGECGKVIKLTEEQFLLVKNLYDGSKAVGLFNRGKSPANICVDFVRISLRGKLMVRDLWRQKDIGRFNKTITRQVPGQGVVMLKLIPK